MSSIYKRKHKHGTTYRCQVRRKGFKTIMKTFHTKSEAKKWGRAVECDWDQGKYIDFLMIVNPKRICLYSFQLIQFFDLL